MNISMHKSKIKKNSIKTRVLMYIWLSIIPLTALVVFGTLRMYSYYHQYDGLVSNITTANEYNLSFKENMDEIMYQIVIGSANWSNSEEKLADKDPYALIDDARVQFIKLQNVTDDAKAKKYLKSIIKLLNTLEDRDRDITDNVQEGGHYDDNMTMLTMNVNILTSLIQNQIQIYISYEASQMEIVRLDVSRQVAITLIIVMVLLLTVLLLSIILSRNLTHNIIIPLQNMCGITEEFAQGDFDVRFPDNSGYKELDTLAESFNIMVHEMSELVDDIRTEQHDKRVAELRLLQAQINPHFLYNTLDTIIWLTEAGEKKNAVTMLTTLSDYFRTTLSKGKEFITIAEEESHIRSYLEIQKFRYHDILEYKIEIPEELANYRICKLTLQPIVENALYHGIKNKRGGGMITVIGKQINKNIEFTVSDNGIGMTADELEHFNELISGNTTDSGKGGFGVYNVQQRLQLYFGKSYGVSVKSVYGEGAEVTVRIPAITEPIQ